MGYSQSPLATPYAWGTKNSNPRKNTTYNPSGNITVITIHHMAGIMTAKACADMHHSGSKASANYYVGNSGDICCGVEEGRRAWTTSSSTNDYKAITIEVSNSTLGPNWEVSAKALESTIALCVDICQRNNIKQINYTGDKKGNLTMHCWFASTACPGPYLKPRFPEIANEINKRLNGGVTPTPAPTPTPTPKVTKVKVSCELPMIKKGSKGSAVKVWQTIVGTNADGDFGPATLSATQSFQKSHGLAVDGIVGKDSWTAGLNSLT